MKNINRTIMKNGVLSLTGLALSLSLQTSTVTANDILEGTITGGNVSTASEGQQAAFSAMDALCTSGGGFTGSSLACQVSGGTAGNATSAQQLSPQAAIQSETTSITSSYQFIRGVNQQAQKLLECDKQTTIDGKVKCKNEGNGASGDVYSFIGPFGLSLNGGGGIGDQDTANGQTGFSLDTKQANITIDYSINQNLVAGFSFGYLNTERDLALNSGSMDSDSYRFAPFILFRPSSNSYVTALAGYALVNYESTRTISAFGGNTFSNATAEYDADQYFASLAGGYIFAFKDGWKVHGYARGDYSQTDIESFQENGGISTLNTNSYAMQVSGQSINSVTSTVGAELSYAISTSTVAAVIIPKFKAEWVHEYKNSGKVNQITFLTNPGGVAVNESIATAGPERNWANIGFGLQMLFPHAIVGYLGYDALIIENASNHTITGGIRVNF